MRLFRHAPTGRWIPLIQFETEATPGAAYFPDLARDYALGVDELEVVVTATLPEDFETYCVPVPTATPKYEP